MDKSSDKLYETSLERGIEVSDVVHLTHLTTPGSIYHLRNSRFWGSPELCLSFSLPAPQFRRSLPSIFARGLLQVFPDQIVLSICHRG
ncbi:hypothetical protein NL676_012061 [Syzygium grande]|nr:hypothetical protein NL676_012061 [Syzygium grande]